MAEQHTRPPDLSPTELPQPSVGPVGRYTLFFPTTHGNGTLYGGRYNKRYGISDSHIDGYALKDDGRGDALTTRAEARSVGRPTASIEALLQGIWQPSQDQDPVAGMIADRLYVQALGLGDVLSQIRERLSIYRRHFDELEHAKLDVRNVRKRWTDPMDKIGDLPDPDLVSAIHELESQQRSERLSCWKDLSALRQQVPEQWRQYLSASRLNALGTPQTPEGGSHD